MSFQYTAFCSCTSEDRSNAACNIIGRVDGIIRSPKVLWNEATYMEEIIRITIESEFDMCNNHAKPKKVFMIVYIGNKHFFRI